MLYSSAGEVEGVPQSWPLSGYFTLFLKEGGGVGGGNHSRGFHGPDRTTVDDKLFCAAVLTRLLEVVELSIRGRPHILVEVFLVDL